MLPKTSRKNSCKATQSELQGRRGKVRSLGTRFNSEAKILSRCKWKYAVFVACNFFFVLLRLPGDRKPLPPLLPPSKPKSIEHYYKSVRD